MIFGSHAIVYAKDAARARAFFRETLGFRHVDAGDGWLIFALPPGEVGVHPADHGAENGRHELYLMCDDVNRTVEELRRKGVEFTSPPADHGWGILTTMRIPGGGEMGLYQPRHPTTVPTKAGARAGGRKGAAGAKAAAKPKGKGKAKAKATAKPRPRARASR
jgi:catechol 2,3-dioxygenase-like lactoylglutathione lyase family enzyme